MEKLLRTHRLFIVCFALVIAFWTARVVAINYAGYAYDSATASNSYNSDEIAQQNILRDWQAGYRATVYVGDDNWFIKYPLYVATNNLPFSPVGKLLATMLALLYATAFLALYSIYKFIDIFVGDKKRRRRCLALMAMFLAIIPGEAFYTLSVPNSRNIEVGLTLFLLLQLYRSLFDKTWLQRRFKPKLAALLLLLSCLIVDDPLFLYIIVAPVALMAFTMFVFDRLKSSYFLKLALFILAAFVGSYVIKFLMIWLLPLNFAPHHSAIVSLSKFEGNINLFLQFGLRIFGADIWGDHFNNARTVVRTVYIFVLGLSTYCLARGYKRHKNLFYAVAGFILLWNILTFLVNSAVTDSTATRYLIYAVPIEIVGLLMAVVSIKTFKQYAAVLAALSVGVALSVFLVTRSITRYHGLRPNALDNQVLTALKQNGLTKGYGNYWLAGIQTYLSDNKIHELGVVCNQTPKGAKLKINLLLSEDGALFLRHPAKSFLVYSTAYQASACDAGKLVPLLGQPARILNFGGPDGDYVAIYNYDIGNRVNYK